MYDHALIDRTLLEIARARSASAPPRSLPARLLSHWRQRRSAARSRIRTQHVPG